MNGTSVARAKLGPRGLEDVTVIFRQQPAMKGGHHFGSRLVFGRDGNLFVTLGDRNSGRDKVQLLDNHIGKVVRIDRDGKAPADNPYLKQAGALPEIWSVGHRNIQGAALDPATGELWTNEHGPKGGDELNRTLGGRNYGWPLVTYGMEYSGKPVSDRTEAPGLESPVHYWVPSIATSGLAFYTGTAIPGVARQRVRGWPEVGRTLAAGNARRQGRERGAAVRRGAQEAHSHGREWTRWRVVSAHRRERQGS